MYITNWDEFQKAAEDIYTASPEQTRYVHTFQRSDGDLVLKVTDDRTLVKYKTNQMTDLKKFIALNSELMLKMMNKEMDEDTVIPDAAPVSVAKNSVPEVKTASPKQTPKGKKGKKRR